MSSTAHWLWLAGGLWAGFLVVLVVVLDVMGRRRARLTRRAPSAAQAESDARLLAEREGEFTDGTGQR